MPKITILLALCTLMLLIGTGVAMWHLVTADQQTTTSPAVEGASIALPPDLIATVQPRASFTATSSLLWNAQTNAIEFEQNGFARLPIASLTKLMTAMVAIDYGIDFTAPATIELNEYGLGGQLLLHPGETVTVRDLMAASLVGSANNATKAYVRHLGIGQEEFVRAMNRKAVQLGLEQTYFVEVTGLDEKNVSTAYEVARLAEHAFKHYPDIAQLTSQAEYSFTIAGSGRQHTIRNSNKIIQPNYLPYTGSKTGYLDEARYCLVVRGSGEVGDYIAVILGSPSEPEHFADIQRLFTLRLDH